MVEDLIDNRYNKLKLAIKDSKSSPMTHITDNSLDDFSHSDNQTNQINNSTGISSPPHFIQNVRLDVLKWHD